MQHLSLRARTFHWSDAYNCPNVPASERAELIKTFALEVEDNSCEGDDTDDEPAVDVIYAQVDRNEEINNPAHVQKVDIVESPQFNVKMNKIVVSMVLDTGATGSMISLDLCKAANLEVYRSSHSALLADGNSRLSVVGEVHTSITMGNNI